VEARKLHQQQLQELMARHVAEERAKVDSQQSALARSLEESQSSLVETRRLLNGPTGNNASQPAVDPEAFHSHGELHELCGALVERVDQLEKLAIAVGCSEAQDAMNLSFDERLSELQKVLQDSVQNLTKELEGMQSRITDETESRDVSHTLFKRRLDCLDKTLEGNLRDATKKTSDELELALEGLRRDLAGSLAEIHSSFNQFHDSQRQLEANVSNHQGSETEGQSGIDVTINGHLAELANGVKVDIDRLGEEIEAVGKRVEGEREERKTHNAYLEARIFQLSSSLSEFKVHALNVNAPAMSIALQPTDDSTGGSAAHPQPLGEQPQLLPGRVAEDATVEGQLNANMDCTGGQACFCDAMWKHLMNERSARLHYEQKVEDTLAHEVQARELLASSLEEVRSTHAVGHSELQELVRHHKEHPNETLGAREGTTLQTLEDQLNQEKVDRNHQHGAVIARVDSLQRTVGMFDAIIRKEVVERSEDSRRNAAERRHATLPKGPMEQKSLLDCVQNQARPLTKWKSLPCRGSGLQPSGPRPPTAGSVQVNVSYCASPWRAPSPTACGPLINHQPGPELQPASHSRGASAQVPTVAPPTASQSPVPILRSASPAIRGSQSASNTGRMSGSIVMCNR